VQEKLLQEFKSVVAHTRGKQSLDAQIENVAKARALTLNESQPAAKAAFSKVIMLTLLFFVLANSTVVQIFKNLIRGLFQGKVLSVEDAVDVLTLKDNTDSVGDYATALHLLARAHVSLISVNHQTKF
jgi:nuclear pore complex protein Nup133